MTTVVLISGNVLRHLYIREMIHFYVLLFSLPWPSRDFDIDYAALGAS
jgi:hypothetical protein